MAAMRFFEVSYKNSHESSTCVLFARRIVSSPAPRSDTEKRKAPTCRIASHSENRKSKSPAAYCSGQNVASAVATRTTALNLDGRRKRLLNGRPATKTTNPSTNAPYGLKKTAQNCAAARASSGSNNEIDKRAAAMIRTKLRTPADATVRRTVTIDARRRTCTSGSAPRLRRMIHAPPHTSFGCSCRRWPPRRPFTETNPPASAASRIDAAVL